MKLWLLTVSTKDDPFVIYRYFRFNEPKASYDFRQELAMEFFTALAAGSRVFEAGVGVDSSRPYFENCSLDVLGRQSTGEYNRSIGKFHRRILTRQS